MNPDSGNASPAHYSMKPRRPKSKEVSSRFQSPPSSCGVVAATAVHEKVSDPVSRFLSLPSSSSAVAATIAVYEEISGSSYRSFDVRKQNQKGSEEDFALAMTRHLWPSNSSSKLGSLAEQIKEDRIDDIIIHRNGEVAEKFGSLSRQKSCSEFRRFENENDQSYAKISRENHDKQSKGVFGGSMRYTGKLLFSRKSSGKTSSHDDSSFSTDDIVPGRMSISENVLRRRSPQGNSKLEDSGSFSSSSHILPKKSAVEVTSRSMSFNRSPTKKNKLLKRASTMTNVFGGTKSKWALAPGRSGSPPMTVENKGVPPMSFSSIKPPTSPSKVHPHKGVGNLLSKGLDLIKGKGKNGTRSSSPSPLGPGTTDSVHQLRMNHNRLVQWRYANARANDVKQKMTNHAERDLIASRHSITKLQYSVVQKRIQLEKEKLQLKLYYVLQSQIELLKAWGDLERQHTSVVSSTKDCLHSVICRIPLVEGAKMDPHLCSIALRRAVDVTTSIKSMLCTDFPKVEATSVVCSELADVVAEEKALLQEFLELLKLVSSLEEEERSLKCCLILLKTHQYQEETIS